LSSEEPGDRAETSAPANSPAPTGPPPGEYPHLRLNYLAHTVEGGLFIGGMAFVNANSVLPKMVSSLGGPSWLISVMPLMMALGFVWPPLLTAHRVERLWRMKPFVMFTGVFQRLPVLVAGLTLFLLSDGYPRLVLAAVALAPLMSGICGGLSSSAWWELVARTVPANRRASVWALRQVITASLGILAGGIVAAVLDRWPGTTGYGALHLIAFGFAVMSYMAFMLVRETPAPPVEPGNSRGLLENLRGLPALIRSDRRLHSFIPMQVLGMGIYIMVPFLAIHALTVCGRSERDLGFLVVAQMVGHLAGNCLAGFVGDRRGGKLPLVFARALHVIVCGLAAFAASWWVFTAVFFLLGAGFACHRVGWATLSVEICPPERRPTYMAMLMTFALPSMLTAAGLSTAVRELSGSFALASSLGGTAVIASLLFLLKVRDPRGEG
jgi:MFS family permease